MHTINDEKRVFWHRDLPPLDAEPVGEHTIEATSGRVPGTIAHRDDLWQVCHGDLMAQAGTRMEQELTRLGGDYAHVFDQVIDCRRDDVKNEAWLHGRFDFVLYRRQAPAGVRTGDPQDCEGAAAYVGPNTPTQ